MKCGKEKFRSKGAAMGRAKATTSATFDAQMWRAYRCKTCRFPDNQRAWHWGHMRLMGRRP